jgi:hypothetical protein
MSLVTTSPTGPGGCYAVGAVLLVKGVIEIVLLRRIFGAARYSAQP